MHILGIESSCDETAAAILRDDKAVLACTVNSQIAIHALYGGVVPELASRQHLLNIYPVVAEALRQAELTLEQIDLLAVTEGPGLVGCLLVGHSFAKALSLARGIPLVGVDHLNGHLLSVFLGETRPAFPFVAMLASGGHTSLFLANSPTDYQLLGRTRDDAAGEAFDKVAKLLGLGYPGGPVVSRLAAEGDPAALKFPRAWLDKESLDFSFSGLKTAVAHQVNQLSPAELAPRVNDICAAFQEAVVDVIVTKTIQAAEMNGCRRIVLAGGVAANPRLRQLLLEEGKKRQLEVFLTPNEYCTDNAAMIALAGYHRFRAQTPGITSDSDVYSRSPFLSAPPAC
ncbi:MAG TPA: tRNA (adenosine(37)-N6)-threonylcarbamoyltransferase complex transferase subunit TsaD [Desulfurivibrionaceae bacterium]|nr:tRNA (adenosine(37)-N6)-threonylcarbamoyltransferase complex transferase subunit TsaD [Desulfurivibrionaceae bacterium]